MDRKNRYELKRKEEMERMHFRLTKDEKEILERKAQLCNMTMTYYLRKMIREGVIVIEDNQGRREVEHEINKIGINVNQIARIVNENGNIDDDNMQLVLAYMKEIKNIILEKL